jgi:hypothetical protein
MNTKGLSMDQKGNKFKFVVGEEGIEKVAVRNKPSKIRKSNTQFKEKTFTAMTQPSGDHNSEDVDIDLFKDLVDSSAEENTLEKSEEHLLEEVYTGPKLEISKLLPENYLEGL